MELQVHLGQRLMHVLDVGGRPFEQPLALAQIAPQGRDLALGPEAGSPWAGSWLPLGRKLAPLGPEAGSPWAGSWLPLGRKLAPLGPEAGSPWAGSWLVTARIRAGAAARRHR